MSTITRFLMVAALSLATRAMAQCAPGTNWTRTWTDGYGQTTYEITAPCKVFVGIPFDIVLAVTDTGHPNTSVAFPWKVTDNGTTIAGTAPSRWITTDATGKWRLTYTQTYPVLVIDHTIEFSFNDLGEGEGAHGFAGHVIGALTVDPYPEQANTPPVASAGADAPLRARDQITAVIPGTATDADSDPLTFRWLEDGVELQTTSPVGLDGSAPLDLAAVPALSPGDHALTLEVSDGKAVASDSVTVTILPNVAPAADAGADATIASSEQATLIIAATATDADGDALSYRWLDGDTELQASQAVTAEGSAPLDLGALPALGAGVHVFTLEVSDGIDVTSDQVTITVESASAPSTPSTGGCSSAGIDPAQVSALIALVAIAGRRRRSAR